MYICDVAQLLCRYEQANLDTLKRERDHLSSELRVLATKKKVSVRAEWRKEDVPALSPIIFL